MQDLSVYDVSRARGFLPDPIQPLSDPYYSPWERLVEDLPDLLALPASEGALEKRIEALPSLEMDKLKENEWKRTHSIFTFLVASWVWGGTGPDDGPNEHVPFNIAKPFLAASAHLGIVPTSTYAGLALYNWTALTPSTSPSHSPCIDYSDPENLQCLITFTGTPDEEWFYLISVAIEAAGGSSIGILLDTFDAVDRDDSEKVTELLIELGGKIRETWRILDRIYERCSSGVFYHQMRPFWAGYKGTEKLGNLPEGIFYETDPSDPTIGEWHKHDGGSAAQSSLYHVFDTGLGVKHITGNLRGMRALMPKKHSLFLDDLEKRANLRDYVMERGREKDPQLYRAYEDAVKALTSFRDAHMRMATKYIAKASRENSPLPSAALAKKSGADAYFTPGREGEAGEEASRGTGGTPFLAFLKQIRDETKAAAGVYLRS